VVGLKNVFDSAASIEHMAWLLNTMLEFSDILFEFQNIKCIFNLSLNCFQHNNMWDVEGAILFVCNILFWFAVSNSVCFCCSISFVGKLLQLLQSKRRIGTV
jgi:hypothetical protein